jgi:hypothetical protein
MSSLYVIFVINPPIAKTILKYLHLINSGINRQLKQQKLI